MTVTITPPAPTFTFTIPRITGELRAYVSGPRPYDSHGLQVGSIRWDSLTINGKNYGIGSARILYAYQFHDKARAFIVDLGNLAYQQFTDSARTRVRRGIEEAIKGTAIMVEPTVNSVNAELLETAYQSGLDYGKKFDRGTESFDRIIRDWHSAYNVFTGSIHNEMFSLPIGYGIVTVDELKAEFLAAAQASISEQLAKVEKRLG